MGLGGQSRGGTTAGRGGVEAEFASVEGVQHEFGDLPSTRYARDISRKKSGDFAEQTATERIGVALGKTFDNEPGVALRSHFTSCVRLVLAGSSGAKLPPTLAMEVTLPTIECGDGFSWMARNTSTRSRLCRAMTPPVGLSTRGGR